MSDFTQVPVLLLYAVNSLTLKAWITTSSESSLRQIAWLQAVVWAIVALWRCALRRQVLRSVTKQVSAAIFQRKGASFDGFRHSATAYPCRRTAVVRSVLQLYPCTAASQLCAVSSCGDASLWVRAYEPSKSLAAFSAATVILSEGAQVNANIRSTRPRLTDVYMSD